MIATPPCALTGVALAAESRSTKLATPIQPATRITHLLIAVGGSAALSLAASLRPRAVQERGHGEAGCVQHEWAASGNRRVIVAGNSYPRPFRPPATAQVIARTVAISDRQGRIVPS